MLPTLRTLPAVWGWTGSGACSGQDTEDWYCGDPTELTPLCGGCPVWRECRLVGIGEEYGVWGGLSEMGRRSIRQRTRHSSPAVWAGLISAAMTAADGDVDDAVLLLPDLAGNPLMHWFDGAADRRAG